MSNDELSKLFRFLRDKTRADDIDVPLPIFHQMSGEAEGDIRRLLAASPKWNLEYRFHTLHLVRPWGRKKEVVIDVENPENWGVLRRRKR